MFFEHDPQDVTRILFQNFPTWMAVRFYLIGAAACVVFAYGVWTNIRKYRRGVRSGAWSPFWPRVWQMVATVLTHRTIKRRAEAAGRSHSWIFYGFAALFVGTSIITLEHGILEPLTGLTFWYGWFYLAFSAVLDLAGVAAGEYLLATAHRAANVDDPARLASLVELLLAVPGPVVLPLHPRTRSRLETAGLLPALEAGGVRILPPLGYLDFTALLLNARAVLTDSGGAQKEAYLAGVQCVTMRDTTEWTETVHSGWNSLVDLDAAAAIAALELAPSGERPDCYGDGHAADAVVAAISSLAA